MENLFGTDGIRGRVVPDECDDAEALQRIVEERELTPQLMQLLGEALGRTLPEDGEGDTIVIGWDERPDNHTLASWLTLGFHASNCTVVHIGLASTPMLHYAVLETGARLGCMITASHNPVEAWPFEESRRNEFGKASAELNASSASPNLFSSHCGWSTT